MQFLKASLGSLVKDLKDDGFKHSSKELLKFVKQKGFCLYKYMDSFEKSNESLPSKDKVYKSLTGKSICNKDYEHAVKVLNVYDMKK